MGRNKETAFKEDFGAGSTFIGGMINPRTIGIVGLDPKHPEYIKGVDVPLEDWNADLWDAARLTLAISDPIDPESIIQTVEMGGSIDPIKVVRRQDLVLAVNGRRRILATRAANRLLVKRGESPENVIDLPTVQDKSSDVEITVRAANEGTLIEPPYVKAANAGRLARRGKSDDQIRATFGVDRNTVDNWIRYDRNLDPRIKALIERPKGVPFKIGVELAVGSCSRDCDPAELRTAHGRQWQAWEYLQAQGAKLTNVDGAENAKAVIRAVVAGTLTPLDTTQGKDPEPASSPSPSVATASPPANEPTGASSTKDASTPPSNAGKAGPKVSTATPKLSTAAIREIAAHLEPSPNDPFNSEADRLAHGIFQVLLGNDPTAEGLTPFPRIQEKFRKVVRSGPGPVIVPAEKNRPPSDPAAKAANVPATGGDIHVRSIPCTNPHCDKGHDKSKRTSCSTCEGYGKLSPARAAALRGKGRK